MFLESWSAELRRWMKTLKREWEGIEKNGSKFLNKCLQILNSLTKMVLWVWGKNNIKTKRRQAGDEFIP